MIQTRNHLSKLETGAIGEKVVISYLRQFLGRDDARALNAKTTNFPVDLVQDHGAIEVKAGLVSNGAGAQQWRATIGQPGKAETEWLRSATPEQKHKWNEAKGRAILDRKNAALKSLSEQIGRPVKGYTMTTIINPDTRSVDLYKFSGFHLRIAWNSPEAQKGYVGSFRY